MDGKLDYSELTDRILKAFYRVYNGLGYGFLEKVYENVLLIALREAGLRAESQVPICVYFEGQQVGEYFADILVEGSVILEIKASNRLSEAHQAQLTNHLKATGIRVGLLLNFSPEP